MAMPWSVMVVHAGLCKVFCETCPRFPRYEQASAYVFSCSLMLFGPYLQSPVLISLLVAVPPPSPAGPNTG